MGKLLKVLWNASALVIREDKECSTAPLRLTMKAKQNQMAETVGDLDHVQVDL